MPRPERRRTRSPEELLATLGLPGPLPHLLEALTHPSFANEQRVQPHFDNQRMEFLGDAVLGLLVSQLLVERFPQWREGDLSLTRSSLVNAEALASWARSVDLASALRLGRGAEASGEHQRSNVLADAVEALVAAVYLDRGLDEARPLVEKIVAEPLSALAASPTLGRDAKSALQERVQAAGGVSPRYVLLRSEGADHERTFVVQVESGGQALGEGRGRSKKLAEQAAASEALRRLLAPPEPRPTEPEAPTDSEEQAQGGESP